jgi:HJR/Mrr/RecB family endonuclease
MMGEHDGNPALIISKLIMLLNPGEFLYRNSLLIEESKCPTLTLEHAPQIVSDLRFVNRRILDRIGRKAAEVYNLSARQFEELVAELFDERGYKVELTQQTRDGGKDLIILDHCDIGNFMIYAECKRYAPNRPVGVSVISDLVGRISADRATAGMVITSSYFSPDAQVFQSKFEHQMSLIDFVKLSSMIESTYY